MLLLFLSRYCLSALLFLLPAVANSSRSHSSSKVTSDDYLVEGIEEFIPAFSKFDGNFYSGTISTDPQEDSFQNAEGGSLMFFLFAPHKPVVTDSLIVWFNGGPGCSSVAGMFFENSPITVPLEPSGFTGSKFNDPLVWNEYGWTNTTAIMYMEQPHGVGFSQGPEPKDESDVARYFTNFLRNFYDIFGEEWQSKRLYLFGESYAGYYVPSIAHKIHQDNKQTKDSNKNKKTKTKINLAGLALGNGWVDAKIQGPILVEYAWYHGLIDTTTKQALEEQWDRCMSDRHTMKAPFHSFTTPDDCGMVGAVVQAAGGGFMEKYYGYGQYDLPGVNIYDVTTWDGYAVLFDDNSTYSELFNNKKVQKLLHAPDMEWMQCIPGAGRRRHRHLLEQPTIMQQQQQRQQHQFSRALNLLDQDQPESVMPYIAEMLDDAKIDVLIYNGDRDMSTCSQGNEVLLDNMDWSGATDWKNPHKTRRGLWVVDNMPAGYSKPLKNLNFVVVYNSGHLVPYNQPKAALDLVTRYLTGTSFVDHELPVFAPKESNYRSSHNYDWASGTSSNFGGTGVHAHPFVILFCGIILGVIGSIAYKRRVQYKHVVQRLLGLKSQHHNYEQVV